MKPAKLSTSARARLMNSGDIKPLLKEFREKGNWKSMENLARKAVELRPDQAEFHLMLGTALHNQGKAMAAEQAYAACLRIDPRNMRALINLGSLQISGGQPEAGLKALEGALFLQPGNIEARIQKGRGLGIMGKPDEALKIFDELSSNFPNSVAVLKAQAVCHMDIGHKTKAAELLFRAAELAPDDTSIQATLKKVAS